MVADWLWPFKLAVTVALWLLLTLPEVARNVALLWPDGTVMLTGTESSPLLLLSDTAIELVAVLFNVTVQVLDALLPSVEGAQTTEVSCAGALAVSVKFLETPLRVAVSTAV